MRRGPARPFRLSPGDREVLETVRRGPNGDRARRAAIILAAADGVSGSETAQRLGVSRRSVTLWLSRYREQGIDCLADRPRSGRPTAVPPANVISRALSEPPPGGSANRWTTRSLGHDLGVSAATITRTWQRYGVTPSIGGGLELATRPPISLRSAQIVGIFAAPPLGIIAFRDTSATAPHPRRRRSRATSQVPPLSTVLADGATEFDTSEHLGVITGFAERACDAGLHVIVTGIGASWLSTSALVSTTKDEPATVTPLFAQTFSDWLRALDALEAITLATAGAASLGGLREAIRSAEDEVLPAAWSAPGAPPIMEPTSGALPQFRPVSDRIHGKATMRDVASHARVSVKTVSNVLTGAKPVSPATRARVDQAIENLGYRVNTAARQLRTGRRGAVVLALPELRISYFAALAEQIIETAADHQLDVLVQTTGGSLRRELEVVDSARRRADGLIIAAQALDATVLRSLTTTGPLVLLGEAVHAVRADQITISNAAAARTAMEHLLDNGRRRIVLLGVAPRSVAEERVRGCQAAARAYGAELDPDLMIAARGWRRDTGEQAILRLLDREIRFDAVLGFNDELALGALHALLGCKIAVPDDVAVVGFDNSEDAAFATPSLTSIAPDFDVIARTAVDLVVRRETIDGAQSGPLRITAPHRLKVRASSERASSRREQPDPR